MMHFKTSYITVLLLVSIASAQFSGLNDLAKKAGKLYFGTATDNGELSGTYLSVVSDTHEFGQLTPSNGQKVRLTIS
jgi:endo-1,4-beta-xylanase